ncbi:hypothetical protein GOP47_0005081 [Adiantum capillus-veneris]|uniref:Glutaredoxin domain-containing protein n=1 Tax=Adiantum capillus-veneris TaxID=13818 RepID=A0A9D4V635_ADICA|nr:hypothetical protein GOP47_0005081 [Adiantum capillus-veneris]
MNPLSEDMFLPLRLLLLPQTSSEAVDVFQDLGCRWVSQSPPVRTTTRTTEYSVEYHQHIVALTSSSYGQLKAMQPTESSDVSNHGTSWALHTGRDASCTPTLHSPASRKTPSSQCELHFNSAEVVISETINVKELMMGFEEKVSPRGLWQAEHASSAIADMLPVQIDTAVLGQPQKRLERPLHTVEEVEIVTNSGRRARHAMDEEEYDSGKENNGPEHVLHIKSARSHVQHARSAKCPLGSSPLSQISKASLMSRDGEERSPSPTIKPSPRNSMFSSISKAKSKGAIKHERSESAHCTQQQRKKFASSDMHLLMSMSRRMVVKEDFLSSELSSPVFDPNMVASYERALQNVSEDNWNACLVDSPEVDSKRALAAYHNEQRDAIVRRQQSIMSDVEERPQDVLDCFPMKCPPGGEETIVLYTTTLRGIRKTFEDCNNMRRTLRSYGLRIDERDVSMHLGFLNELRGLMDRVLAVPRLFIKGRYIGGVEEVGKLHEDGKLNELVKGLPRDVNRGNCEGCDGIRFVPCLECRGSCKLRCEDKKVVRCPDCNENGLIQCPICT